MTPTQLNKRIRAGEFFWVETGESTNGRTSEYQALQARTVTETVTEECLVSDTREQALPDDKVKIKIKRPGQRRVKVETERGWFFATRVRPAGGDWISLSGEGRMDRAIN